MVALLPYYLDANYCMLEWFEYCTNCNNSNINVRFKNMHFKNILFLPYEKIIFFISFKHAIVDYYGMIASIYTITAQKEEICLLFKFVNIF